MLWIDIVNIMTARKHRIAKKHVMVLNRETWAICPPHSLSPLLQILHALHILRNLHELYPTATKKVRWDFSGTSPKLCTDPDSRVVVDTSSQALWIKYQTYRAAHKYTPKSASGAPFTYIAMSAKVKTQHQNTTTAQTAQPPPLTGPSSRYGSTSRDVNLPA